jgi:hypothetical protein
MDDRRRRPASRREECRASVWTLLNAVDTPLMTDAVMLDDWEKGFERLGTMMGPVGKAVRHLLAAPDILVPEDMKLYLGEMLAQAERLASFRAGFAAADRNPDRWQDRHLAVEELFRLQRSWRTIRDPLLELHKALGRKLLE